MTLALTVAIGYVAGRVIAHLGGLAFKVVMRMTLERSPRFRALVRSDVADEVRLKESLGFPSSLRR